MNSSPLALFNGSYLGNRPTGIGVVARDLVNALDSTLIPLLDPLGGSRPNSIRIPGNLMPECGRKGHFRRLVWTQQDLPSLLKQNDPQFLLSPLPEAPFFRGVRSIVLAHDLLPLRYPQITPLLAYHLLYVPLVLHSAEIVLCNSEATAREVNGRLGIPIRKLITIPLGFNQDRLVPLQLKREPFFLVLGRHDPHKNLSRILKALSHLKDKEVEIWFVGPHDPRYTPNLKKLAKDLGVIDRTRWISWVDDRMKLKLINTCQALIIASLWEGFGLPALEAMACNTPVIASSAGALPEVVADAGLLINPIEVKTISDAMKDILFDCSLRDKCVKRGQERVKLFQWNKSAKIIENLLLNL